ncbi:Zinc finger protein 345, partial [Camponotus floridanus]
FLCKVCKKSFSSKLDKHMHIKSSHVGYMSSICDARFKLKHKLLQHYLSEHLLKQNQCCVCYIFLSNYVELRRHLTLHYTQPAMCNICNLVFETHNRYTEHKMYYYKNHTFLCSLCGQNFQGMYMLNHHNKLTHYSEDKRKSYNYICEICGEGFSHESHFHSHNMHVHLNEENLSEIAKESEGKSQFDHTSDIQEQIRDSTNQKEIEQLPNEYICHICQLKCIDADDMEKHTALYSNDGNFKCDRCKRQCKTLDLLYQHRTLTHICRDIYNGYVCCICGEVLETIISLECHKKHFHSNDIAFKCNNADDS